ncbi:hypothetical protein VP01_606g2 [Puccinia sorghi]|uniref:Uncharacterized protein n=1 Tax=Puccinia sorghi TaxID=27349 RepID=A0A0L6UH79_9BASI|nr:hypothetical protein VP01_606g2 [Puccinia sorghi]
MSKLSSQDKFCGVILGNVEGSGSVDFSCLAHLQIQLPKMVRGSQRTKRKEFFLLRYYQSISDHSENNLSSFWYWGLLDPIMGSRFFDVPLHTKSLFSVPNQENKPEKQTSSMSTNDILNIPSSVPEESNSDIEAGEITTTLIDTTSGSAPTSSTLLKRKRKDQVQQRVEKNVRILI